MSNDPLEMPKKKKSSSGRTIVVLLAIIAILGVAAWKLLPGDKADQLADAARQQLSGVVDRVTPSGPDAPGAELPLQHMSGDSSQASGTLNATSTDGDSGAAAGHNGTAGPDGRVPDTVEGGIVQPPAGMPALPGAPGSPGSTDAGAQTGQNASGAGDSQNGNAPGPEEQTLPANSSSSLTLSPKAQAELPTVSSALTRLAAPTDAGSRQDSVVTSDFVRNLARWLVAGYQPPSGTAKTGRTSATLMAANMRYGSGLYGLRYAGGDPVRGREAVLRYVYTPGMLDALYRLYIDRFVTAMADASLEPRSGGKPPLTDVQAADMFSLYAGAFRRTAAALRGTAALDDLHARVQAVLDAGQAVVQANSMFAEVLFAYEQARDDGNEKDAELLRRKMIQSTENTQKAEQARGAARRNLADAVKRGAGGRTPGDDTLIYLAEWVDRRGGGQAAEATLMAANVLERLAGRFDKEAELLRGGGAE